MFTPYAKLDDLRKLLVPKQDYRPFPRYEEREAWAKLPEAVKASYLAKKQATLDFQSPALSASKYMEWYRTNQTSYGEISQPRREALMDAMLIECIEGKGEMIDKIIDLVWALCEETSWVAPSHNNHMHNYMWSGVLKNALPDITDENFVDLFSAFTAGLLASVYYFLKAPLDAQTPLVCKRIEYELKRRVEEPFWHHDDMTWMGFYGHKINNWNPTIVAECLFATLAVTCDPERRLELAARYMEKLDIYADQCPADGGCDEGPGYWTMAGAALLDNAEMISDATRGGVNLLTLPVMRNMAEFQMHMIDGKFALNFADNGCRAGGINADMLYRYGKLTGSDKLCAFALSRYQPGGALRLSAAALYRAFKNLFGRAALDAQTPPAYEPEDWYYPDIQVLEARSASKRLFLGAKAGFNNESHNHNDVGTFAVYVDGKPALIDVGNESYTAKTFSPYRYEIWCLQSDWHSTLHLNGFAQHAGDEYRATEVEGGVDERSAHLTMQLRGLYEAEAQVKSAVRTVTLDKAAEEVRVTDELDVHSAQWHFITYIKPTLGEGYADIPLESGEALRIAFDPALSATVDEHHMTDAGMMKAWDTDTAYRIRLNATLKAPARFVTTVRIVKP